MWSFFSIVVHSRIKVGDLNCYHCDPNPVCCEHCDSNCVCCDLVRPKNFYEISRDPSKIRGDFARPKKGMLQPLRLRMSMLQLCATKIICANFGAPKRYFATIVTQNEYVLPLCDRNVWAILPGPTKKNILRLCATQKQRVEVCIWWFDRLDPGSICYDRPDPRFLCLDHADYADLCSDFAHFMFRHCKLRLRLCRLMFRLIKEDLSGLSFF